MANITINLNFSKYFGKGKLGDFPDESGVYCIYSGVIKDGNADLHELLYIGKAGSLKERLKDDHHALRKCNGHLRGGEILFFNYAFVPKGNLDRTEAALINKFLPPENDNIPTVIKGTSIRVFGESGFLYDFDV